MRGNRRTQRAELESTWSVYDATRPIRKEDMEPEPAAEEETRPPVSSSAADSVSMELGKRRRALRAEGGST